MLGRLYTGDLDVGKFLKSESLHQHLLEVPFQAAAATDAIQEQQQSAIRQLRQQPTPTTVLSQHSQQVAGLLSQQQQQQQFGSQGLGGLAYHPGALAGQRTSMGVGGPTAGGKSTVGTTAHAPFVGQFHGAPTTATGFAGASQSAAGAGAGGTQSGGSNNPISMASLQSAIEALLARGLPQ